MKPNLTDALCTRCGLCCDGSLFADVELANTDEAETCEIMGLEIEDADARDGPLLLQPCRALKGTRCSIYAHRPDCCRTFECRLLQEVGQGKVGVEQAQAKIAETLRRIEQLNQQIGQLGRRKVRLPLRERYAEALALTETISATGPELNRRRAELRAAMTAVEGLIQKTFL
jgi:Fe-S-cluster containining protein